MGYKSVLNRGMKNLRQITLVLGISALAVSSCKTKSGDITSNEIVETLENTEIETHLQDELNEKKANFEQKASDEKKRIYADGITSVKNSGITESALNLGDKAVDFSLKNAKGEIITLYEELKKGPVVLTWYRGGWCPYCNITLHYLQEELPNFKAAGANLIALTPEKPDSSLSTIEKNELEFEVLSDLNNVVAKKYGIVFTLTPEVANAYQQSFDLHAYNDSESNELPMAATYVIDQNGIIRYAFLHEDYRNRAEPSDILKAIRSLN